MVLCRACFEEKVEISMSQRRWKLYLWFDSVLRNTKNIGFKLDSIDSIYSVVINDGDKRKRMAYTLQTQAGSLILIVFYNI